MIGYVFQKLRSETILFWKIYSSLNNYTWNNKQTWNENRIPDKHRLHRVHLWWNLRTTFIFLSTQNIPQRSHELLYPLRKEFRELIHELFSYRTFRVLIDTIYNKVRWNVKNIKNIMKLSVVIPNETFLTKLF